MAGRRIQRCARKILDAIAASEGLKVQAGQIAFMFYFQRIAACVGTMVWLVELTKPLSMTHAAGRGAELAMLNTRVKIFLHACHKGRTIGTLFSVLSFPEIACSVVSFTQGNWFRMVDMRSESGFTPLHFAVSASNATAGQPPASLLSLWMQGMPANVVRSLASALCSWRMRLPTSRRFCETPNTN